MSNRGILLTAVGAGVTIVQFVLPVPANAGVNHWHPPQWRVEVNQIDAGGLNLGPEFKIAIYENLVTELTKAKQFSGVLRSGDGSANGVPPGSPDNKRLYRLIDAVRGHLGSHRT